MVNKTERFADNSTWSSIRNTMNIIAGRDLLSYTLLFLDDAENQPTGTHISINNENIMIGRAEHCKIRYGEKYATVSREQCYLRCDKDKVILQHNPQASNPTLVNDVEITFDHELRNGDEIQLSYGGPKLRFNKVESKLASAGITGRLNVAISQATKPLKTLIYSLGFIILLLVAFAGYTVYNNMEMSNEAKLMASKIELLTEDKELLTDQLERLIESGDASVAEINRMRQRIYNQNSRINRLNQQLRENPTVNNDVPNVTEPVEPIEHINDTPSSATGGNISETNAAPKEKILDKSVFPLDDILMVKATRVEVEGSQGRMINFTPEELIKAGIVDLNREALWTGSAILTSNEGIVMGRHVAQPWRFRNDPTSPILRFLSAAEGDNRNVIVHFTAESIHSTKWSISFTSQEVKGMTSAKDRNELLSLKSNQIGKFPLSGNQITVKKANEPASDIAKVDVSQKGSLSLTPIEQVRFTPENVYTFGIDFQQTSFSGRTNILGLRTSSAKEFKYTLLGKELKMEVIPIADFSGKANTLIELQSSNKFGYGRTGGPAFIHKDGKPFLIGVVPDEGIGRLNIVPGTF